MNHQSLWLVDGNGNHLARVDMFPRSAETGIKEGAPSTTNHVLQEENTSAAGVGLPVIAKRIISAQPAQPKSRSYLASTLVLVSWWVVMVR